MGLFPRKIGGRYAMIERQDNESLYLIYSDDLLSWNGGTPILLFAPMRKEQPLLDDSLSIVASAERADGRRQPGSSEAARGKTGA